MHLLGRNVYINVTVYEGRRLVHIRRYDEDNERPGRLYPSKVGICMTEGEYEKLKSLMGVVDQELTKLGQQQPPAPRVPKRKREASLNQLQKQNTQAKPATAQAKPTVVDLTAEDSQDMFPDIPESQFY